MLIPRILTAIALLAVLLPALFAGSADPFAAVTLVLIVAACWEWGRLNQAGGWWSAAIGIAVGVGLAILWWLPDESLVMAPAVERIIWLVASAVWVLGAAFFNSQRRGRVGQICAVGAVDSRMVVVGDRLVGFGACPCAWR